MTEVGRREQVPEAFDGVAHAYDRLVAVNPGYHAHLRLSARRLVAAAGSTDGAGLRLLDLGCGTGASTAALLAAAPRASIVAVDGSAGMLAEARAKDWPDRVTFHHARAENLVESCVQGPFDGILAAYLVRNLEHRDATLRDLRDLLRRNAPIAVHEYSVADSAVSRLVWAAVCRTVIIPMARVVSGDATLYRYLRRSVVDFDGVRGFEARLRRAGFTDVRTDKVPGWQRGIAHTFLGRRAASAESSPNDSHRIRRPGTDRRATKMPAAPGRPDSSLHREQWRVAVIGGGIAGLSAAVALAERGVAVRLLEREQYLGGRVGGWTTTLRDGSRATMTRGFHAFFRQYYNLRSLLRRVDPGLDHLVSTGDYPLLHADGRQESFAGLPRTPPWNLAAFVARSPSFTLTDLFRFDLRAGLEMLRASVPATYRRLDHLDAETYLDQVGFPASVRDLAFSVFSRSFFAHPSQLSAAELVAMFHQYFLGSSEGLLFDVPSEPFPQALWNPLRSYLESLGAECYPGWSAERVERAGPQRYLVTANDHQFEAHAVVLATDVSSLRDLVACSPTLGNPAWRDRIARLRTAPPFLVSRYWFDDPVRGDRPAFLATAGFGPLDNISILDRYDLDAQRWAAGTGGSVVELHAYAIDGQVTPESLRAELQRAYPETAGLRVVDERHERRADSPLFPPGGFADRPRVRTPNPNVMLAGDLVRVDLPVALMERAATSGLLAANGLLNQWGIRGHPAWSVPNTGRLRR